jgi:hypothetical protein
MATDSKALRDGGSICRGDAMDDELCILRLTDLQELLLSEDARCRLTMFTTATFIFLFQE